MASRVVSVKVDAVELVPPQGHSLKETVLERVARAMDEATPVVITVFAGAATAHEVNAMPIHGTKLCVSH